MTTPRVIRLVDLETARPVVELPDGSTHPVRAVDGLTMQLCVELQRTGDAALLWEIAARSLPSAPREAVLALSVAQAERVVQLATDTADAALAAALPEGAPGNVPPGSAATPSPTPSGS